MLDYDQLSRSIEKLVAARGEREAVAQEESALRESIARAISSGDTSEDAVMRLGGLNTKLSIFPGKKKLAADAEAAAAKALSATMWDMHLAALAAYHSASGICEEKVTAFLQDLAVNSEVIKKAIPHIVPYSGFVSSIYRTAFRCRVANGVKSPEELLAAAQEVFGARRMSLITR